MRIAMLGVKGIPYSGGIETVIEKVGSRLVKKGHEVLVYVRPHYTSRTRSEYKGMKLLHLPSINTKHLDSITHTFLATLDVVFRKQVDIVHIHSIGLAGLSLIPKVRRFKTIVTSHGLDWQRDKWGPVAKTFLKMSDRFTVYFPDATTAVSKKMQKYYQNRFNRNVIYIPNGVEDFDEVHPQELDQLGVQKNQYILFASRLVPEKGCHYLIKAYRELNTDKKLVLAGDANYKGQYVGKLKKEADDNVLFPGFVKGRLFEELMSNAYIYVQPSEIEGLSNSLLEAMSYKNCVLVSDIEENMEVVGDCAFSFKNKSYEDLKDKLSFLLKNEDIVEEYRNKAKSHILKSYNWDKVAFQYEDLYRSLLE